MNACLQAGETIRHCCRALFLTASHHLIVGIYHVSVATWLDVYSRDEMLFINFDTQYRCIHADQHNLSGHDLF